MTYEIPKEYLPPEMKVAYGGPDRVVITPAPNLLPRKCVICGVGAGRPFIDLGLNLEYYGAVYFCADCFVFVSNKVGYHSPSQFDTLKNNYMDTVTRNAGLEVENERLRGVVSGLLGFNSDERDDFINAFEHYKIWRNAKKAVERDRIEERTDDQRVDEQVNFERSDDVPSTTGNESDSTSLRL